MTYTIEKFAEESLKYPSDFGARDARLYDTHGAFISWAERGDDILAESNYLMVLEHLMAEAGDDADEDIIDGSFGHWAVGSLRQIFVRVYVEGSNGTEFTKVFEAAYEVMEALRDYPVWDEGDFSEREWNATMKAYDEALEYLLKSDEDFPDELDYDTQVALSEVWSDTCYGSHEAGYVSENDIKDCLPDAQALVLKGLQDAQGQTTLDLSSITETGE